MGFNNLSETRLELISSSFSNLCENTSPLDIYNGEESIPFEKRDSLYKNILRKEFSDAIKEFNNTIDKIRKKPKIWFRLLFKF